MKKGGNECFCECHKKKDVVTPCGKCERFHRGDK